MSESPIFHVKPGIAADAIVNAERFRLMTAHAGTDPNGFWAEECRRIDLDSAADHHQEHHI